MNIDKKHLVYAVICVSLLIIGLSFAYFRTNLVGDDKTITIVSDHLRIIFTDNATITANKIMPDWSTSKTFTVTNESGNSYKYDILIEDLVNTFVTEGFLQYKITSDNNGYNMNEWVDVPKRSTATDTVLAHSVEIASGVTQTYTIEFRYPNSTTVNQNADQGKIFTGALAIDEGTTLISFQTKLLADNPTIIDDSLNYGNTNTNTNVGVLYKQDGNYTEDVTGDGTGETVYFFAGNAQNNWVKFGKEKKDTCTYNGSLVYYVVDFNLSGSTFKESNLTEDECLSTNICKVYFLGTNVYFSGLSEEECTYEAWGVTEATYMKITNTNEMATYDDSIKDIYWRIIRTNEQGGVKLLYSGNSPDTTTGFIAHSSYNGTETDLNDKYVGYMFGTDGVLANQRTNENDSVIKGVIDSWYSNNLKLLIDETYTYDSYVSKSAIYCNDRSTYDGSYAATARLGGAAGYPSYRCGGSISGELYITADVADKFSVSTKSGGNGKLTYPVALITADEIVHAGGQSGTELTSPYSWYFTNSNGISITGNDPNSENTSHIGDWWTMSPHGYSKKYSDGTLYWNPTMHVVNGDSSLRGSDTDRGSEVGAVDKPVVRPVLSLKSCVNYKSGDGSSTSPYEVWIDYDCANNEDI